VDEKDGCPPGYIAVTARFLGTRSVCFKKDDIYDVGECSEKSKSKTVSGIKPVDMNIFGKHMLCVRNSKSVNYHHIVK
jgi:hypothetical protein